MTSVCSGLVSFAKLTLVGSILGGAIAVVLDEKGSSIGVAFEKSGSTIHFYSPTQGFCHKDDDRIPEPWDGPERRRVPHPKYRASPSP